MIILKIIGIIFAVLIVLIALILMLRVRLLLSFDLKNAFSFTEMKKLCIVNECLEYSDKDECSAVDFVSCLSVEETKKYFTVPSSKELNELEKSNDKLIDEILGETP